MKTTKGIGNKQKVKSCDRGSKNRMADVEKNKRYNDLKKMEAG